MGIVRLFQNSFRILQTLHIFNLISIQAIQQLYIKAGLEYLANL